MEEDRRTPRGFVDNRSLPGMELRRHHHGKRVIYLSMNKKIEEV